MLPAVVAILLLLNLVALAAFRADKIAAQRGLPRVPEVHLLWLAAMGGTAGAYAGRWIFHHKTRKQPFAGQLHGIAALQLLGLALAVWRSA
jgi:uncharacterized membrane protein YsdA (DUF1294 family)